MPVPRNRLSKSRTGNRRAHHAKSPVCATKCKNCGGVKLPHTLCPSCSHYRGRNLAANDQAPAE